MNRISRYDGLTRQPLVQRMRGCVDFGLRISVFYGGLAAAMLVLQGRAFSSAGLRFLVLLCAAYLAVGVIGGAFVGVILPWARSRVVSAIVGVIVFYPLGVLLLLLSGEVTLQSGRDLWLGASAGGIALGGGISQVFWNIEWVENRESALKGKGRGNP